MAKDHRRRTEVVLRPLVPTFDVDVGAAHAGGQDLDENLTRPRFWHRDLTHLRTRAGGFLDQRAHGRPERRGVDDGRRLGSHAVVVVLLVTIPVVLTVISTTASFRYGRLVLPLLVEKQRRVEIKFVGQQRAAPGEHRELRLHGVEAGDQHLGRAGRVDRIRDLIEEGLHPVHLRLGDAITLTKNTARAAVQRHHVAVLHVVQPPAGDLLLVGRVDRRADGAAVGDVEVGA